MIKRELEVIKINLGLLEGVLAPTQGAEDWDRGSPTSEAHPTRE